MRRRRWNLSLFLEQIADESYGMLNAKGMTCAVDAEEDLMIQGYLDKLARVFDNLLRNAAAYGRENTQILIQARGGRGRTTIVFTNEESRFRRKNSRRSLNGFTVSTRHGQAGPEEPDWDLRSQSRS